MKNWEKHANIFELAQGRRLWKLGRVAELERTDSGSIRSLVLDDRRCYVELDPEFFDLPLQPPEEDARAERERTARSLTDFSHSLDSILSACLPCDEGAAPGLDFVRSALAGVSSPAEDLARSRMADVISQSLVDSFLSSLDAGGDRKREEKEDGDGDGIPLGEIWGLYDMGKTSCTCFAEREEAQSAGLCPHIAATLYALDAGMKITEDHVIEFDAPEPAWEDMISSMKRSELRDLLLRLGRQEPRVRETVLFQRNPRATPFQLERWRMRMRKLVLDCCGTDASLSLTQSTDLYVAVDAFLTEILDPLSRQGLWMDCFEVVCMASREIAALQEKNIMGGLVSLTDRFIQLFRELLSLVTPEERQQMYGWFLDCYHNFQRDPAVFLVLFAPVWEKAELETSLDLLDRDLEECEKLDSAADPMGFLQYAPLMEQALLLLSALGREEQDVLAFLRRHPVAENSRDTIFSFLSLSELPESALLFLQGCRLLEENNPALAARYSRRLADLWYAMERPDLAREELRWLVFQGEGVTLQDVLALKDATPIAQWSPLRDAILANPSLQSLRRELLLHEKLYTPLLTEVRQSGSLRELLDLEEVLGNWNPERFRDALAEMIPAEMDAARTRMDYVNCSKLLSRLERYPGGARIAREISAGWRMKYPRKRAMQEILARYGF